MKDILNIRESSPYEILLMQIMLRSWNPITTAEINTFLVLFFYWLEHKEPNCSLCVTCGEVNIEHGQSVLTATVSVIRVKSILHFLLKSFYPLFYTFKPNCSLCVTCGAVNVEHGQSVLTATVSVIRVKSIFHFLLKSFLYIHLKDK